MRVFPDVCTRKIPASWIENFQFLNPMDLLAQIVYLLQLITALIASLQDLFITIGNLFKPRQPFRFQIPKQQRQPKTKGKWSKSYLTDPRNRQLQANLLTLLKGDIPTAKRLLQQQRRMHPGKSDNWYLEKVIYDLERDRR